MVFFLLRIHFWRPFGMKIILSIALEMTEKPCFCMSWRPVERILKVRVWKRCRLQGFIDISIQLHWCRQIQVCDWQVVNKRIPANLWLWEMGYSLHLLSTKWLVHTFSLNCESLVQTSLNERVAGQFDGCKPSNWSTTCSNRLFEPSLCSSNSMYNEP